MRTAVRAGLVSLSVLAIVQGGWQYFFASQFYSLPTLNLLPPFNAHLMSDVGGLGLALGVVLAGAAIFMNRPQVMTALLAYLTYAVSHLLFHLTHLGGFSTAAALFELVPMVTIVLIAIALLTIAGRMSNERFAKGDLEA